MTVYPTLSETSARTLYEIALATGDAPATATVEDAARWQGDGERLALDQLDDLVSQWMILSERFERHDPKDPGRPTSDDEVEGLAATDLHRALEAVHEEPAILDDPGFWRYVTFRHLWAFVEWRERKALETSRDPEKNKPRNFLKYVDGRNPTECVATRMYLRARISHHDHDYSRAYSVKHGADFWRSHILRVQVGSAPTVARELIDLQVEQPLTTDVLRVYAKRINRMWANVVPHQYDGPAARDLLLELRPETSES